MLIEDVFHQGTYVIYALRVLKCLGNRYFDIIHHP